VNAVTIKIEGDLVEEIENCTQPRHALSILCQLWPLIKEARPPRTGRSEADTAVAEALPLDIGSCCGDPGAVGILHRAEQPCVSLERVDL
jgi:hypothetical protein